MMEEEDGRWQGIDAAGSRTLSLNRGVLLIQFQIGQKYQYLPNICGWVVLRESEECRGIEIDVCYIYW